MDLTFERLNRKNTVRCESSYFPINDWSPTDWACAMAGEVGEACNLVKKLRRLDDSDMEPIERDQTIEILHEKIGKELADVVIYADLLATRLGLNLGECVVKKFNEVSDRVESDIKL